MSRFSCVDAMGVFELKIPLTILDCDLGLQSSS